MEEPQSELCASAPSMDQQRIYMMHFLLDAQLITQLREIVAEYAVLSEIEKVERVFAQVSDGGCFGTFTTSGGDEYMQIHVFRSKEYTFPWDFDWDLHPHPMYAITVGQIMDAPEDYGCLWIETIESMLPSNNLKLSIGSKSMFYIDIVDMCRADYLREMERRMALV